MNIKLIAATAALLACAATPGFAVPVSFNFEGTTSFASVGNFYAGSNVVFGDDLLAFAQSDGVGTYFSNVSSPELLSRVMAPVGGSALMSTTGGFSFLQSVSFLYSSYDEFFVYAYDMGGVKVGEVKLTATDNSCGTVVFCTWNQATLNLTGLARDIDFSGGIGIAGFDNIKATTVPAPAPALLMASGLIMLGRMRKRRNRAA